MTQFNPARAEVLPVFATPFLRGQLELDTDIIAEDCRKLVEKVKLRHPTNNSQNYTTYFDDDIRKEMWEFDWFKQFSDTIKDTYIEFIRSCFDVPVSHLHRYDIQLFAWVSVYKGQHQHEVHNHANSYMSGTYYIETGENTSPIRFYSPALMANFGLQTRDREVDKGYERIVFTGTNAIENEMFVHPIPNEFLIWPSYIQHSVPPQYDTDIDDDYERISLSFNLKHRIAVDETETGNPLSYRFLDE